MTYFSDDFFWLPANPDKYDSHIHLKVDDGHRIWIEMGSCTSSTTWHTKCSCGDSTEECFKELSLDELKELRSAIDNAILMIDETHARWNEIKNEK